MSSSCGSLSRDWRAETGSEGDREYTVFLLPVTDESFPSARAVQYSTSTSEVTLLDGIAIFH